MYHLPLQILLSRLKKAYEKTPTSNYLTIFQINLISLGTSQNTFSVEKRLEKERGQPYKIMTDSECSQHSYDTERYEIGLKIGTRGGTRL